MNVPLRIEDLPAPPPGRSGFPWTEATPTLPMKLPGGKRYPKISIVTPSYKQGQFLEETIRSVMLQGYPNLEYIIMDGGSPDNSVEIIQKYASFLSYWISAPDSGQTNAINSGFARSTGEVMGWLNSDDVLLPGALYQIACTLAEDPQREMVTGFRKNIDEHSRVISNFVRDMPSDYYMRHYCCIAQETTYWRRSLWEILGPLDETLHFAMDYEFWLRAIHRGYSIYLIPKYIGGFRDYADNKSSSWIDVYYRDMNVLYQRYAMGQDEADVHAKLGWRWARRYQLYLDISKQSWTNYPRLVQFAWRVLEIPAICDAILATEHLRRVFGDLRQERSRLQALRVVIAQVAPKSIMANTVSQPSQVGWGDVRGIPDQSIMDGVLAPDVPANTLAFGSNWYPIEYYEGNCFRWSSGSSDIFINNSINWGKELCFTIYPAVVSAENRLEFLDDKGDTLYSIPATARHLNIRIQLPTMPEADRVRYQFRWHGLTLGSNSRERRQLAFRVMRIGWQDAGEQIELMVAHLRSSVNMALSKPASGMVSLLRPLKTILRRWRSANSIMVQELDLWRQVSENLTHLEAELSAPSEQPEAPHNQRQK